MSNHAATAASPSAPGPAAAAPPVAGNDDDATFQRQLASLLTGDQVTATTVYDRDSRAARAGQAADAAAPPPACLPDEKFDVAAWSNGRPLPEQLPVLRSQLIGEFDRADPEALARLARLYIRFGFGAEAEALLAGFDGGPEPEDRPLLVDMARIVDGRPATLRRPAGAGGRLPRAARALAGARRRRAGLARRRGLRLGAGRLPGPAPRPPPPRRSRLCRPADRRRPPGRGAGDLRHHAQARRAGRRGAAPRRRPADRARRPPGRGGAGDGRDRRRGRRRFGRGADSAGAAGARPAAGDPGHDRHRPQRGSAAVPRRPAADRAAWSPRRGARAPGRAAGGDRRGARRGRRPSRRCRGLRRARGAAPGRGRSRDGRSGGLCRHRARRGRPRRRGRAPTIRPAPPSRASWWRSACPTRRWR